jgi:hypothetical protein
MRCLKLSAAFALLVAFVLGISCKNNSTGPSTDPGNLLANPSFESNDRPSYTAWHFNYPADTAVSDDIPTLGGSWSLKMTPDWNPAPWARAYLTGQSGRRVFLLTVWVKAINLSEPARIACGILQPDRTLRDETHVNISGAEWLQYSIQDTLDLVASDTVVVELSPGEDQSPPIEAQALFDLVKLQKLF